MRVRGLIYTPITNEGGHLFSREELVLLVLVVAVVLPPPL